MSSRFRISGQCAATLGGALLLCGWISRVPVAAALQPGLPVLTNATQFHRLSPSEAELGYLASVRGVSTFYHRAQNELFIQDETGGILVRVGGDSGFELGPGQLLQVHGITQRGALSTELKSTDIVLIGEGPTPVPRRIRDDEWASGQFDASWVEASGVVRALESRRPDALLGMQIALPGPRRVLALIQDYHLEDCRRLVDAEVTICGVLRVGKSGEPMMMVPSMGDIAVTRHAPPDPFGGEMHDLGDVGRLALRTGPIHRIKVQGVVASQEAGRGILIEQNTNRLFVPSEQAVSLRRGDVVEAVGFPGTSDSGEPWLEDAIFRKLRTAESESVRPHESQAERPTAKTARRDARQSRLVIVTLTALVVLVGAVILLSRSWILDSLRRRPH